VHARLERAAFAASDSSAGIERELSRTRDPRFDRFEIRRESFAPATLPCRVPMVSPSRSVASAFRNIHVDAHTRCGGNSYTYESKLLSFRISSLNYINRNRQRDSRHAHSPTTRGKPGRNVAQRNKRERAMLRCAPITRSLENFFLRVATWHGVASRRLSSPLDASRRVASRRGILSDTSDLAGHAAFVSRVKAAHGA